MERLALGLVLLAGTLATSSPLRRRDLNSIKEVELDMVLTSFDDQYRGCSRMMEEELEELNRTEFANSIYAEAWTHAATEWRNRQGRVPQLRVLRPEQEVALLAYTMSGSLSDPLYKKFNKAVREAGCSRREYLDTFHFKALHFLLTKALHALQDAQPRRCYRVYRGIRDIRFTAWPGQSIRFGQFASSSFVKEKAQQSFGQDTFFSVETCYGVPIRDFSFFPNEEEVLIPPFEIFEVTDVARDGDRALIHLRSQDAHSNHNCEWVKEKRCKDHMCIFSAGRSIPRDLLHFWGLLLAATALAAAGGP
ncbi:Erythroblast NAD(P)(+)--arginine ADP-ribosyltransferase, partial [Megadyptes antipodes antipodes]